MHHPGIEERKRPHLVDGLRDRSAISKFSASKRVRILWCGASLEILVREHGEVVIDLL
jgi:hypothetical protein